MDRLPPRYQRTRANQFFKATFADDLKPGAQVLDMGPGRAPVLGPGERPGCTYVGLDISAAELAAAPAGAYDETVVGDITHHALGLDGRFDVVLSWQVLEHVSSLRRAFENSRAYLKPGGVFVAYFSGKFSLFALANQVLPPSVARWLLSILQKRADGTVFPAPYDRCWYSAIEGLLAGWGEVEIVPEYCGLPYFTWCKPLARAYLALEDWLERSGQRNLATHYLVVARKAAETAPRASKKKMAGRAA